MLSNKVIEIRWHARGGQGAVTAAKILAEMTLEKDMYFQAFPEYGAERMGAPIQCFNRLSENIIRSYCAVLNPDIVVVVDPTLLDVVDITEGMDEDGEIIVNSEKEPDFIRKTYNISGHKIATVDATNLSINTLGRFMPNVPMLGAVLKITGLIDLQQAKNYLDKSFSKKFSDNVVKANLEALKKGYEGVISE